MYSGSYHGTKRHASDLPAVLKRAKEAGCQKLILTGSDLEESKNALAIAKEHRESPVKPIALLSEPS